METKGSIGILYRLSRNLEEENGNRDYRDTIQVI